MTRRIRLLALIEATSITGPAKNLLQFAELVRESGWDPGIDVELACFDRGGANTFLEAARARGFPVHAIPEKGALDFGVRVLLRKLIDEVRPDVLQTHAVKGHFLARLAGLPARAPWIAFHHGYTWTSPRVHLYNQLDRWSLRATRQVITVSQPFRAELMAKGVPGARIEVLHNAIDPDWGRLDPARAAALRAELGIPESRRVLLIVGRLSREKDHLTLVRTVARLIPHDPHLLIVGDGPERTSIEREAAALDLTGRVTFTGLVKSAEPYYGLADIAVLSSRTEGSPNALLEAMAARVPVVATRVGGIPEIVTDGESALLVPPSEVEPLAAALDRLLADRDLASHLADRAAAVVRERHSPRQRARRLWEIYCRLAASTPP
jgi:glycosyltransferase involved in cell wall biosynthesis